MTDTDRFEVLHGYLALAIAAADDLGLAHLHFLLAMATIEACDQADRATQRADRAATRTAARAA